MVGYAEYANGYKVFYPSYQKTFIERSVQFKEEPTREIELAEGECSNPPLHDDVSDDTSYSFYDSYIYDYYQDIHLDYDSPIQPKWAEKTIQAVRDLVGDPLDSIKTRSQIHNAFSTLLVEYFREIIYDGCIVSSHISGTIM